jgi:transposase
LTADQLSIVTDIYRAGSRASGFDADRWTTMLFAQAIQARFGVRYDPDHVGRIMHRLGLRERRRTHRRVTEIYPTRYMTEVTSTVA